MSSGFRHLSNWLAQESSPNLNTHRKAHFSYIRTNSILIIEQEEGKTLKLAKQPWVTKLSSQHFWSCGVDFSIWNMQSTSIQPLLQPCHGAKTIAFGFCNPLFFCRLSKHSRRLPGHFITRNHSDLLSWAGVIWNAVIYTLNDQRTNRIIWSITPELCSSVSLSKVPYSVYYNFRINSKQYFS